MNKFMFNSTIIIVIILVSFTIFTFQALDDILSNNQNIQKAIDLSMISMDFNIENFHTQLEIWEYAYLPNSERLDAFYIHKTTLDMLLEKWHKQIKNTENNDKIIYENGVEDMLSISKSLELVKNDWVHVIKAVKDYQFAVQSKESKETLEQLRNIAEQKVVANEKLFDELDFNKNVDIFVINQKSMIHELQKQQEESIMEFKLKMIIVIPIAIGASLLVNFVSAKKDGN